MCELGDHSRCTHARWHSHLDRIRRWRQSAWKFWANISDDKHS